MKPYTFEDYLQILKDKKLKQTLSRVTLLKVITAFPDKHFTIHDIIDALKKQYGKVNVMSVYNNVQLLLNNHMLFANTFNGKNVAYELITPHLIHIRCDYCGKLYHLDGNDAGNDVWWQKFAALTNQYNVKLEHYKLEVHGICDECEKKR